MNRHTRMMLSVLLLVVLRTGMTPDAMGCPPDTFDYGSPCLEQAAQIVLCHSGSLLPDPQECARAARDLGLIGVPASVSCGVEPKVILIETLTPTDPDLVCINQYYQVTSFTPAGFGDWWIITFPRPVNESAMAAIYSALPAVLTATVNVLGYTDCYPVQLGYVALPNGTWHWIAAGSVPYRGGCRGYFWHVFVSLAGQVMIPGDLNCDGVVNVGDVPLMVGALLTPDSLPGCDTNVADVNGDGATDGDDVQPFLDLLIP